jgi:hypothetical protein
MTPRPTSVSTELQLRLVVPGAASLPVRAGLRYDVTDPYAVQVLFHTGAQGEGDVQVWPSASAGEPVVCLSLCSPSGKALFEVPLPELVDFLGQTYAAIPTGSESDHVDVDAELALLLWAEPEL